MCECCRDTRGQWYELIELGDEEAEDCLCEFSTEEEPAICGAPARYEFKERYVEGHLCVQHMRENKEKLEWICMRLLVSQKVLRLSPLTLRKPVMSLIWIKVSAANLPGMPTS